MISIERAGTIVALIIESNTAQEDDNRNMDLYTRNILVGIFAVLVMGTVVVGEMVTWTNCDLDTAKNVVQKIGLSMSALGAVFLGFIYFKGTKKRKRRNVKGSSFFSHKYHVPTLNVKK